MKNVIIDSQYNRPIFKGMGISVISNGWQGVPLISRLFCCCRPPTIVRRIRALVINAIQGCSFGWLTHVYNKLVKLLPAFTDLNAPAAPIGIFRIIRILAPALHFLPPSVKSSTRHAVGAVNFARFFFFKATATLGIAGSQVCSTGNNRASTITLTSPQPVVKRVGASEFHYRQPNKSLSNQIDTELIAADFRLQAAAASRFAVAKATRTDLPIGTAFADAKPKFTSPPIGGLSNDLPSIESFSREIFKMWSVWFRNRISHLCVSSLRDLVRAIGEVMFPGGSSFIAQNVIQMGGK